MVRKHGKHVRVRAAAVCCTPGYDCSDHRSENGMDNNHLRASLPLDGIRVVALEQAVAGPLCSRHLADLGADVVKVERPDGGDFARRYDSAVKGLAAHWVWLNRGKRSVTLDVKRPDDM